jgi:hypothetical protein
MIFVVSVTVEKAFCGGNSLAHLAPDSPQASQVHEPTPAAQAEGAAEGIIEQG